MLALASIKAIGKHLFFGCVIDLFYAEAFCALLLCHVERSSCVFVPHQRATATFSPNFQRFCSHN
jgi:hypothetical protein